MARKIVSGGKRRYIGSQPEGKTEISGSREADMERRDFFRGLAIHGSRRILRQAPRRGKDPLQSHPAPHFSQDRRKALHIGFGGIVVNE